MYYVTRTELGKTAILLPHKVCLSTLNFTNGDISSLWRRVVHGLQGGEGGAGCAGCVWGAGVAWGCRLQGVHVVHVHVQGVQVHVYGVHVHRTGILLFQFQ